MRTVTKHRKQPCIVTLLMQRLGKRKGDFIALRIERVSNAKHALRLGVLFKVQQAHAVAILSIAVVRLALHDLAIDFGSFFPSLIFEVPVGLLFKNHGRGRGRTTSRRDNERRGTGENQAAET